MKNLSRFLSRFLLGIPGLLLVLLAGKAPAAVFYWDNNGTGTPTSGTWDTTSAQWATSSVLSASTVAWNTANAACFTAGSSVTGTINITVNQAITMAGIFNGQLNPPGCALTISGAGSFNLASGVQAALATGGSDGQPTVINIPFTGPGQLWPEGSKNCTLNAHSTYSGGTVLNQGGLLFFQYGDAFGTGPIYPFVTGSPTTPGFTAILDSGSSTITIANNFIIASATAGINFANASTAPVVCNGTWDLINSAFVRCAGGPTGGLTLNGVISDSGALTLSANNSSPIVLNGANTYGGGTTLTSGNSGVEAVVGNLSALGYGPVTVNSASTLELNGFSIGNSLTLNGTGTNANGALINSSATPVTLSPGAVGSITVTAGGSGYSAAPSVTISGGGGSGATGKALLGVSSASFTITPGTQLYSVAPTVTIGGGPTDPAGPNSSSGGATATIALAGTAPSVVASTVTITAPGLGFTGTPTISFSGGTKSGTGTVPTGTGNANNFVVSGVAITAPGSGYTSAPSVTFGSGAATATAAIPAVNLATTSSLGGAGNITINDIVAGAGGLTKIGAGTVTLTAANTYSGATTVSAGTLVQGAANVIPSGTGKGTFAVSSGATFDLGGFNCAINGFGTSAGTIDNTTGAGTYTLTIGNANGAGTHSGVIKNTSGTLSVTKTGTGAIVLSGANTYTGKTIVNAGTLTINTSGDSCLGTPPASYVADQLTLNAGATFSLGSAANATLNANRGITLGGAATINLTSKDLTVPGIITGSGPLTKSGANALILSGANNYSGGTLLTGGTLTVNNNTALGSGTLTITPAGICTVAGKSGTTTLANSIAVNAGGGQVIDFFATTGNNLTLNGQISGSANITRGNGGGAGNVTLNGDNSTYSGTLSLLQGPLILGHKNALGTGTLVVTPGSVAISLGANTALTGANAVANTVTLNGTLPVSTTSDLELSGVLSGVSGAVTKSGAATLILSGANIYGGTTTVSGGTLLVNNVSGSGTSSGAVTVQTGGTLGGTGTIAGLVTVNSGGTLAPGATLGTLTLAVAPVLSGTTAMDLNKAAGPILTSDKLVVSPGGGTLTYGGALVLTTSGLPLVAGDTFTLFSADSYSGGFTSVTPAPGPGLAWDTSQLAVDGTLKVVCDGSLAAHAGANQSLCNLGSAQIGGSPAATGGTGSYTYSWSPSTGLDDPTLANPTASPTTTTTYTLTVTDSGGCTAMASVTVTTGAPVTISAGPSDQTACVGSTATFSVTASGPGTLSYSWAKVNNAGWGSAWSSSGAGATFRASATDNDFGDPACSSLSSALDINSPSGNALGIWGGFSGDEVAVRTFPALSAGQTVSVDFDNGNVDTGSKVGFSLQTSGGADVLQFYFLGGQSNYKYNDGTEQDSGIPFQRTGLRVQFALTAPNAYTLIVTPCGGTATKFNGSFSGTIAQLKLFNQNTTGGSDKNIYFNNFLVGGYTDNADNYSGDFAGQDKGNQPIVAGNGASTYTTPPVSGADNGTQYQVVVSSCGGSVVSSNATLFVNPLPTVSVNSDTICAGGSSTLTATTSASNPSYLWSPGGATTASVTVSPAATTLYTVLVTDGTTGCTNSASGVVTVNPLPTVSVNSDTICAGGSSILTATTSASNPSYLWSPGGATTASITVSPASTTTYTVTVTDGTTTCANSASGTVTVNPLPSVSVNSQTVCAGGSAILTATTGASNPSYLWSPGGATTASITVSPASTTTYTVTVTDGTTGCVNSGSGTVTVNPLPSVSVNSQTICAGDSATLTATTSASNPSYLWSPGGATTASITVSPASTTTYTVTVTDGTTTCANSASGTVTVNPLPTVSVNSQTICAGDSTTLTATTSASNPSYLWSPGGATTASITVSPSSTTTYTVTVTDGTTSCGNSGSGTVTVNPLPVLTTDTTNQVACAGSAVMWQVAATGTGLTYQWQRDGTNLLEGVDGFTGTTTAALTNSAVGPQDSLAATNGYACVVSNGSCSVSSTLVALTVNPVPTVSVNSDTICAGGSSILTATTSASNPSYLWSPGGATTASITVSPTSTTTYTVTVVDGTNNCPNSASGTVTVNPLPTVSVNSQTICAGDSATLTATTSASNPSYLWSPGGATTASITVSPTSTTTYTVMVTDGTTSCANSGSGTVTVNPAATASAGPNQTVCSSSPTTAPLGGTVGGGATGGTWSSSGTGSFSPDATTLNATYTPSAADITAGSVTLTLTTSGQLSPCGAATAQVLVTINAAATASAGGNQTVCQGNSTTGLGGAVGGSATGGTWSSSGTGTFSPSASTLNAIYTPSAADLTAGTVTLTLTTTGQASPCGAATAQVVVTINPAPVLSSITRSGSNVTLVWSSVSGVTYRVQYKNNLTDTSWTDLVPDVTASGATATTMDTGAAGANRFYRVLMLCP